MNYDQALLVSNTLSSQTTYYKSMDVTSQITQLNALQKLCGDQTSVPESTPMLKVIIERRIARLKLTFDALFVLESQWDAEFDHLKNVLNSLGTDES